MEQLLTIKEAARLRRIKKSTFTSVRDLGGLALRSKQFADYPIRYKRKRLITHFLFKSRLREIGFYYSGPSQVFLRLVLVICSVIILWKVLS